MSAALLNRMRKELQMLAHDPPPGIWIAPSDDNILTLQAKICGSDDSPYANGTFSLEMTIPDRYPFVPPAVRFLTPIYHPNIDSSGRICLDLIKNAWKPSINLSSLLVSIQLLMSHPNCDDALMVDIAHQFVHNRVLFDRTAKEWTIKFASESSASETRNDRNPKRHFTEIGEASVEDVDAKKARRQ
jgi:ubiquitin-conjugating enzyme E2 T